MRYSILLFVFLVVASCKDKAVMDEATANTLPGDFVAFYERFLQDSIYQIEHINFPLEGIPDNVSNHPNYNQDFRWEQSDWVIHRPIQGDSTGFSSRFAQLGPIIIEELLHESGQYGMLRRFSNNDNEWRLIYYAGLNPLKQ